MKGFCRSLRDSSFAATLSCSDAVLLMALDRPKPTLHRVEGTEDLTDGMSYNWNH
jgi:hypothetical protein